MKNPITREKIKALLSSDEVIDAVMAHLNFTVNDDMWNGCTLVAELKEKGRSPHMQLQVRLTRNQYFENYHDKAPVLFIDKNLDITSG